jgi:hypothetical protein
MGEFPTVDFIHLCRLDRGKDTLEGLANNLNLDIEIIEQYEDEIEKIMDFMLIVDDITHKRDENEFLADTFHADIASDLRSIIILSVLNQRYQANIILRHFIETFIVSIWADIISRFQDSFDYFLDTKEWKPYKSIQRVTWEFDKNSPNRSIKERLERIRLINMIDLEGKDFYKEYFSKACSCDLILLLSLPICEKCMTKYKGKVNFKEFDLDPKIRKKGKEDKHAVYKTDFGFICSFCGYQKLSQGFAMGIPDVSTMADMLVAVIDDPYVNDVRILQQCYNHLSEEYVHFSTTIHPDRKPKKTNIGGRKVFLYGLNGVLYCIGHIDHLMEHYFERLQKCNKG